MTATEDTRAPGGQWTQEVEWGGVLPSPVTHTHAHVHAPAPPTCPPGAGYSALAAQLQVTGVKPAPVRTNKMTVTVQAECPPAGPASNQALPRLRAAHAHEASRGADRPRTTGVVHLLPVRVEWETKLCRQNPKYGARGESRLFLKKDLHEDPLSRRSDTKNAT